MPNEGIDAVRARAEVATPDARWPPPPKAVRPKQRSRPGGGARSGQSIAQEGEHLWFVS